MKPPKININEIRKELFKRSYLDFIVEAWPIIESRELILSPHIELIARELQIAVERVGRREPKQYDLVINIPPGMSKSTLVTIMLHPWAWGYYPWMRFISSSYSNSLSVSHAIKSRDIILSDTYQSIYGLQIKEDKAGKSEYANIAKGERIATSIGGTITGKHADIIIIDDPINPKKAQSAIERENANEYIKNTLNTRKTDTKTSLTILVMQRLHTEDVTGLFLNRENIRHICLPAELSDKVQPEEAKEIYKEGLLDPNRLPHSSLAEMKVNLGSYAYAGQYQQQPAPDGGGIWQDKWFNIIPDREFPTDLDFVSTDWDLAYTKTETNSACAWITSGQKGNNIYLDEIGFEWVEYPAMIRLMMSKRGPHYIENKASGISAKQSLSDSGIIAIETQVGGGGDKIARARIASPIAEAGRVYVRESQVQKLLYDTKQGIIFFPNGSHNDVADVLSQCLQRQSKAFKTVIF